MTNGGNRWCWTRAIASSSRAQGGPSAGRAEIFPPRLEIPEPDGTYVLIDVGPRADWHYLFVPHT